MIGQNIDMLREIIIYRVAQNGTVFWYALTSSNINRFSKLFHSQNQAEMCNDNTIWVVLQ